MGKFQYSYSITLDNTNGQTLQHLSSKAKKEFYDCGGTICPTATYDAFVDHYGEFDYADKWIQAAFGGSRAVLGEREFDFSALDVEGRSSKSLLGRMGWLRLAFWLFLLRSPLHNLSYPRPFYPLLKIRRYSIRYRGAEPVDVRRSKFGEGICYVRRRRQRGCPTYLG